MNVSYGLLNRLIDSKRSLGQQLVKYTYVSVHSSYILGT